jgi:EAL and modified HD-GYP domain-containing signal transduction protein
MSMLGHQNLRQWLQVILLSDLNATDKAQELVRISVRRGRFLQLLASAHPTPFGPDSMFLLGFFSVLDAILDQFMDQVLEEISLDPAIKAALTDPKNADAAWVGLLDLLDRGNWAMLESMAWRMGIPMALVDRASVQASEWTDEVMGGAA